MELVITDKNWDEVGVLGYTSGDFAFGADENDFSLQVWRGQDVPKDYLSENYLVYSEDGEVGGMVRGIKLASNGEVTLTGVTWTGFIGEHVLCPPNGSAYFTASGEVGEIARTLMSRLGLSSVVRILGDTGLTVTHTFSGSRDAAQQDAGRYMNGWSALWQLLYEHGCKASFAFNPETRTIDVTVGIKADRTDDEEIAISPSRISATVKRPPNHLVCLGKGELAERTVIHLYADANGNVSTTQSLFGNREVAEVYDDSSAEDADELSRQGTSKLKDLISECKSLNIEVPNDVLYDVGDLVGGMDERTGLEATAVIVKKIVRLSGDSVSREYKTTLKS